jgi:exosome complex component RRP45
MGALMHFRRPEVTVDGTEVTIHEPEEREPVKLTLHHKPFTITLGYTKHDENEEKIIILDPSREEENVLDGNISIAINKHREVNIRTYQELVMPYF